MEIDEFGEPMANETKKSKLLSVEDYLDFFDNRDARHLTVNQLLQIIGMHGFRKIRIQKKILIDIVSTIELMELRRSTLLNDSVSGDAPLALEEVIDDLKHLDWKECHVTSLLNQGNEASASATSTATSCNTVSVKRRGSKKRKNSKKAKVRQDLLIDSAATTLDAGSTAASLNF
ncbi:hypothetical protein F511_06869 [Dorcoceras hygrometricum]|uniref:DUF7787 domain-containing protein n=1 Tax=Dorcoceras hygrometricum TaxID=472368 RepID=A0A2Z7BKK4_9LAMI|nr:hypothetical protein F511_06869 [Dorcoceras hygrometricum]